MPIVVMRNKTPEQVRQDVAGFARRYVQDWTRWLAAPKLDRPQMFGEILRRWQATRPLPMRRLHREALHGSPFLEELLAASGALVTALGTLDLRTIANRNESQTHALSALWQTFSQLPAAGSASCVGISKAVLLVTYGAIGPAFDSQVRRKLRIGRIDTFQTWVATLEEIADDLRAFEMLHGSLVEAVPQEFAQLACGRLYDMVLGPR